MENLVLPLKVAANDCPLAVVGGISCSFSPKAEQRNFKPEQKHNSKMLFIAPNSSPDNGKRYVGCSLVLKYGG